MKYLKTITILSLLLIAGTISSFAQDTGDDIKTMLVERDQEIKDLLGPKDNEYNDEQRENLKEIINGIIDFEEMAKQALDETYDTISEENRLEFVELFSTIIRDQSLNKLDIYRATVTYNNVDVDGEKANVETMAELDDIRTPVSYAMIKKNSEWVISDMVIDDVSTAGSYNRQFQRIIARRGFDSLMESLRKRAARS